jgi:hypothetical protein
MSQQKRRVFPVQPQPSLSPKSGPGTPDYHVPAVQTEEKKAVPSGKRRNSVFVLIIGQVLGHRHHSPFHLLPLVIDQKNLQPLFRMLTLLRVQQILCVCQCPAISSHSPRNIYDKRPHESCCGKGCSNTFGCCVETTCERGTSSFILQYM